MPQPINPRPVTRRSRRVTAALAPAVALALGGCAQSGGATSDAPAAAPATRQLPAGGESLSSVDAGTRTLRVLGLRVFELELPRGRVSSNKELWRRIDEQAVDAGTYDVLYANGVRVGVAPVAELPHVSETLDTDQARRVDILGKTTGRQTQELPLETGVFEKTLFWFDAAKRGRGRTFQRCDTLLSLSFEPSPGTPGSVRISMVPVVRSSQPQTVITAAGNDVQVTLQKEETLFDLKLAADVALGQFLIVSPSEELRWRTSLGRQFFCREVTGELLERVYVIVPQVIAQKEVPSAP